MSETKHWSDDEILAHCEWSDQVYQPKLSEEAQMIRQIMRERDEARKDTALLDHAEEEVIDIMRREGREGTLWTVEDGIDPYLGRTLREALGASLKGE